MIPALAHITSTDAPATTVLFLAGFVAGILATLLANRLRAN